MPTVIRSGIQGLGWFLRRGFDPLRLGKFYEDVLGLPRLREWEMPESTGVMLWVGGVGVLETNSLHETCASIPETQYVPVFRSCDLAASERRLATHKVMPTRRESDDRADTTFFVDADDLPFAIEQVSADARNSVDAAWREGVNAMLPGGIAIDGEIEGLGRIIHHAPDVEVEERFLTRMGLTNLGGGGSVSRLAIGNTCIVELRSSQLTMAPIDSREMSTDTWIMRVYGQSMMRERLAAVATASLSQHVFQGGTLDYALSPSNRLIGWQERKPYDSVVPMTQLVEDLDARSRWLVGGK